MHYGPPLPALCVSSTLVAPGRNSRRIDKLVNPARGYWLHILGKTILRLGFFYKYWVAPRMSKMSQETDCGGKYPLTRSVLAALAGAGLRRVFCALPEASSSRRLVSEIPAMCIGSGAKIDLNPRSRHKHQS